MLHIFKFNTFKSRIRNCLNSRNEKRKGAPKDFTIVIILTYVIVASSIKTAFLEILRERSVFFGGYEILGTHVSSFRDVGSMCKI